MMDDLRKLIEPLASLKLTVTLLALSMVLIFAGTTVQTEISAWDAQRQYFHTWLTLIDWRLFFPLWTWAAKAKAWAIPFPGGYALISLLLINLVAAHSMRFKLAWKRSGILLIHGGLILLLVGEFVTSIYQVEGHMTIDVGGSANYTQDSREVELAVIDPSPADHDVQVTVPAARLVRKGTVQHPKLPFALQIDEFYLNSDIAGPRQPGVPKDARATAGVGQNITLLQRPKATGTDAQNVNTPSAYVTLTSNNGQPLGTYLLSTIQLLPQFPQIDLPQVVQVDGRDYWIQLRFKREYKPYTLHLLDFTHDRYTGTDVAKNFASRVRLVDPRKNVDREVLIWMNHPLRYDGETFYQASFKPGDKTSILQVVRNPGWLIPYVSCTMVGLGLLVHFGMHLLKFLSTGDHAGAQRSAAKRRPGSTNHVPLLPAAAVTGLCILYLLAPLRPAFKTDFDIDQFARLPVSFDGRTMPLDSLARNSLRIFSGRSELATADGRRSAVEWLTDVFARPQQAAAAKIFRINHPDILSLLGLNESQKLFSVDDIKPVADKLLQQYSLAESVERTRRDLYQRKVVELGDRVQLLNRLAGIETLFLSPPLVVDEWRTFAAAMHGVENGQRDPGAESFLALVQAMHENQPQQFNAVASEYRNLLEEKLPQVARKLDVEVLFNRVEPFYRGMVLYVIVFLLAAGSWLKWHGALSRAALWVLMLALIFHTLGLVTRIYLQGRPPVTNLYSSAIFIAWAAVAFCVGLEFIYRNGVASAAAAAVAFPSLLIAHHLADSGDTMKMLQAVLDTNFWLATHVVVVTLGYAATFLAGFLAIGYVLGGVLTTALNDDIRRTLARMVYGVVCFAMLFSFVGTILGGIWADQSWGRFWGWDPKENGAVLIVVWNAIILHSRWGGLVKYRGFMLLAIFGNIITAWSWFGTNMLGVGLHSYGFMDSAVFWLAAFAGLQLAIIALGTLPQNLWRSHSKSGVVALATTSS